MIADIADPNQTALWEQSGLGLQCLLAHLGLNIWEGGSNISKYFPTSNEIVYQNL